MLIINFVLTFYQLVWPTNSSRVLTSTFAEPRDNRYHTGIDISTWNREDYKCFAVSSGFISRIVVSNHGYGKALYLKLTNGKTAVYAHLSKFHPEIEKYIEKLQIKNKKYKIDISPEPKKFKFKKNDIIAFTGSTGIGTPHLHFEMRDENDHPLNPLDFIPLNEDNYNPDYLKLKLIESKANSVTSQYGRYLRLSIQKINANTWIIPNTIRVKSFPLFAVSVEDRTLQYGYGTGVETLQLYIDETLFYEKKIKQISFSENIKINSELNLTEIKYFYEKSYNLFEQNDFNTDLNTKFNKDRFKFRIFALDHNGNKSELFGEFQIDPNSSFMDNELSDLPFHFADRPIIIYGIVNHSHLDRLFHLSPVNEVKDQLSQHIGSEIVEWNSENNNRLKSFNYEFTTDTNQIFGKQLVYGLRLDTRHFGFPDTSLTVIAFQPQDLVLKQVMTIIFDGYMTAKTGVYEWNHRNKKWNYISQQNRINNKIVFKVSSLGIYTTISDQTKPSIQFLGYVDPDLYMIYVEDNLSGIKDEENLTLMSGKNKIFAEYDYEENLLKIKRKFIQKNKWLKLSLYDNSGNFSRDSTFIKF